MNVELLAKIAATNPVLEGSRAYDHIYILVVSADNTRAVDAQCNIKLQNLVVVGMVKSPALACPARPDSTHPPLTQADVVPSEKNPGARCRD